MNKPLEALTYDRLEAYARRCNAYRARHGSLALSVYASSQELFVVKSSNGEEVTLISVQTKSERICPESDLRKSYIFALWVWDEMVFYFGNEAQQAAQRELQASVSETIEACLAKDELATATSEFNGATKACTACYWHHIVARDPGKTGLHACVNPVILDQMIEDVDVPPDEGRRHVNCDSARRMGQICGPRSALWHWGGSHSRELDEIVAGAVAQTAVETSAAPT